MADYLRVRFACMADWYCVCVLELLLLHHLTLFKSNSANVGMDHSRWKAAPVVVTHNAEAVVSPDDRRPYA